MGQNVEKNGGWWLTVGISGDILTRGKRRFSQERCNVFVGVHERQLDPKGRLALPAAFRPRLEPRCFLSIGRDNCIDVLTAEAMEDVARDMLEKVRKGELDRNAPRALAANSYEVTIDGQGRVNIDEKLREYAGISLNSKVVVSGSFDRVEIWEPERHERNISAGTQQIAGAGA